MSGAWSKFRLRAITLGSLAIGVGLTGIVFTPDLTHAQSTVPLVDLANETSRQVVVDREAGQYLGHPTTVLLEDGRTIITVYPKGHGRGPIVMKRSRDGGLTWSDRLPVLEPVFRHPR